MQQPAAAAPAAGAVARRPRAFGRTSNVWQYVESVQERRTPPLSRLPSPSASRLRRTSLDFDDDDASDASDDNNGDARHRLHARRRQSGARQSVAAASAGSGEVKRKFSKNVAAHGARATRPSKTSLKGVSSLPELHPLADAGAGRSGSPVSDALRRNPNAPGLGGGAAPGSPTWRRGGSGSGGTGFSSTEVIKRIQALGTSASAPHLALASGAPLTTPAAAVGASGAGQHVASPPGAAAASAAPPPSASASQPPAALSDADKLRNDFSSQQSSKLYFGCSVAFELFNGHLMMVGSPDGQVRVQALERLQAPQIKGCRDRAIFTLLDLADVRSANTICYGDAVWLQLSVGTGEASWEQGGVLGAKVREAPQLKALALSSGDAIRNSAQAPAVVGQPVPVKAYLPKSRDDGDTQADEIQSRVRNKGSKMLGKWIIRSAVLGPRRQHKEDFVYNNDEVFLEQDWFYLGADSDAGVAVLRQLPPASAARDAKDGEYLIERRAAWRIRLLDSTSGGSGLSLAQQQMERLLFRAKVQLKQSKKMRAGHAKAYAPDLQAGGRFTRQLRAKLAASTSECDQRHLERQDRRLDRLATHLAAKADAMNRRTAAGDGDDDDFAFPSDFALREAASEERAWLPSSGDATSTTPQLPPPPTAASAADAPEPEKHVCALCQSSTIGYNLCSQIQSVLHALRTESRELPSQRSELTSGGSPRTTASTSRRPASAGTDTDDPKAARPLESSRRKSRIRDAPAALPPASPQQREERGRILALFSLQDAHMREIIRFKERTAQEALAVAEYARMGLSPVATHFRDRFKHVGLLAQAAQTAAGDVQDGIGGHFQKLHAELLSGSATGGGGRKPWSRVEQLAQALGTPTFALDDRTCPLAYPGEGFDVFGHPVDCEAPDPVQRLHVFPTDAELELLAPVDTKAVMDMYAQNRAAVAEMLDGFVELCETHMVPTLRQAAALYSRASLVESLEFTARAAEFVCARRLQVRVARLLHEIAESDVGAFAATFDAAFAALLAEFAGTLAFIRFYRDTGTSKRKQQQPRGRA